MERWFEQIHVGRSLSERERQFVGMLTDMLEEVRPAQIEPAETSLAAEGKDLITLLPHRVLGGVSIVVNFVGPSTYIQWAQIWNLSRYHDDLDQCVLAAEFLAVWRPSPPEAVVAAVRGQLEAPIYLQRVDSTLVSVSVRDKRAVIRPCGQLPLGNDPVVSPPLSEFTHAEVRMTDRTPPPVTVPSNARRWFDPLYD